MKIYIAGPYSARSAADVDANVSAAIDAALHVFRKGHYPYIPHLTHFVDRRANETGVLMSWSDYIKWDLPWVATCDAVLCLGESPGVKLELEEARRLGKRILYSIDDVEEAKDASCDS